ncbi:5-carboxymethyl-2-hydroxymuconate Delta-isomerase [Streptomyces sp. NBC_01497]|uniref:5-carboxymethyl-2-hydroxymuconate Delta-isomerase n=1 Tax=Streptomyces sp. NBC_01497 TaxID=2903885 RepID=UPI002E2FE293|nr:5-carboxymethyl-2-hydroxymuconate Delta-isomerase [Streptomyces sp. NBC_01497]
MPQITVDHSADLTGAFDPAALAHELHTAAIEIAAAKPEACKTLFRPCPITVVGHDTDGHAVVHVTVGLLAGRTEETRTRLADTLLEQVRRHVKTDGGTALHASVEIRDLDPTYRKFDA